MLLFKSLIGIAGFDVGRKQRGPRACSPDRELLLKRHLLVPILVAVLIAVFVPCASADLFVISQNTNSVLRYNELTGQFIGEFVSSGSGGLQVPRGLLFGRDGHLYITSSDNDSVMRYDGITGVPLPALGQTGATFVPAGSGGLKNPSQVILGNDRNLYVDSQDNNAVLRYDGATGAFLGVFVPPGSGGLNSPRGLVFGPDGNLYVKQRGPNVVLRYHGTTGAPLPASGQTGAVFVSLEGLRDGPPLLFGPDGNLYIGDFPTSRILRFNGVTGEYIDTFVSAGSGGLNGPGPLMLFGADNKLYICSENSNSVLRYDGTTGAFIDAFVSSGSGGLNLPHGQVFSKTDPTTLAYVAQSTGTFTATGNMTTNRYVHTATLLPNGKVLIAGGVTGYKGSREDITASAELYDPPTGTFIATGNMTKPRRSHSATLLPDGTVLIAGGDGSAGGPVRESSAEVYDPSTGAFTATKNMNAAHVCHSATLLGNGQVLIVGSDLNGPAAAELYDPTTGVFAVTVNPSDSPLCPTATLLPDGRVLAAY